jgi:hypothetical protein
MERDIFTARGHPLITSRHRSTLEITRDRRMGTGGDCIVAVSSSKGCRDLSGGVKSAIREGGEIYLLLEVRGWTEEVKGVGHPDLELSHPREMVFRKSDFLSPRTVFIRSNRAASDLPRDFVSLLAEGPEVRVTLGSA